VEEKNVQPDAQPPSSATLLKSTALAAGVAAALLVTVVMPAEYGIDPTGIGNVLGLKKMGELKESLAHGAQLPNAAPSATPVAAGSAFSPPATDARATERAQPGSAPSGYGSEVAPAPRTDEMTVTLAPGAATEIKVTLEKGKTVSYSWSSDGGKVSFDVHGDSTQIKYHGYGKGSDQAKEGTLTAAFTGSHGWFWRNRTPRAVNIKLKVTGEHTAIKHLK
jgi:hypothetical protein